MDLRFREGLGAGGVGLGACICSGDSAPAMGSSLAVQYCTQMSPTINRTRIGDQRI